MIYRIDVRTRPAAREGRGAFDPSGEAIRHIWESLYGIHGLNVKPERAAIPGTSPPASLPTFVKDGSILPPGRRND